MFDKQGITVSDKIILPAGKINIRELFNLREISKGLEYSLIMYFLLHPVIDYEGMKARKQFSKKAIPQIESGIVQLLKLGFIRLEEKEK